MKITVLENETYGSGDPTTFGLPLDQYDWLREHAPVYDQFAAANFDPAVFDQPRRFDLERDPNPHFSFGKGPHSCLGKHVAALEIKLLLEELLQRTKEIRPAGEISYLNDTFSRGVYELPVTMTAA